MKIKPVKGKKGKISYKKQTGFHNFIGVSRCVSQLNNPLMTSRMYNGLEDLSRKNFPEEIMRHGQHGTFIEV